MKKLLNEARAHLGAALMQVIPSDDAIIIDHIRMAQAALEEAGNVLDQRERAEAASLPAVRFDWNHINQVERNIAPELKLAITVPVEEPVEEAGYVLYVALGGFGWQGAGPKAVERLKEIAEFLRRRAA
ncbi:MAG TPA: hypothetical protein VLH09_14740 [Bryobacteraceae bacterium]|nr:hypothetical protein [Bryobacteraceae bacterium]